MATKKASSPRKKASGAKLPIDAVMRSTLKKLQSLAIETRLQADIEWCLGSYGFDKNPSGLVQAAARAAKALQRERTSNPKSVTAKLIKELENVSKGEGTS